MFRKTIIVGIVSLLLSGVALFFLLVPCLPCDREAYQQLLAESAAIHARHTLQSHPIEQWREGVQREIWSDSRYLCFKSGTSHLLVRQREGALDIQEEAEQVEGTSAEGTFRADQGSFGEGRMVLKGNVQFQSEELFGIADQLVYDLEGETTFLTSEKRVLFWERGMALSAPEIRIQRKDRSVRGLGEVHFSFDVEEKEKIAQTFSRFP